MPATVLHYTSNNDDVVVVTASDPTVAHQSASTSSTTLVPCRAAPLPANDNDLLAGSVSPSINVPARPEPLVYDEVMDGLSDDECDCESPVRAAAGPRHHMSNIAAAPRQASVQEMPSMADLFSINNNSIVNTTRNLNEDAYETIDGEDYFDGEDFEVDSMVDLEDRTYEHLFEDLTVVAVDDYNNRYYAAVPHFTSHEETNVSVTAGLNNNYAPEANNNSQPNAAELIYAADGTVVRASAIACESPASCEHHSPRYFYSAPNAANGDKPHSNTHTHSARNAALYKSANEKYFDKSGHLGWRWGLVLGNSEEELEEERVWLHLSPSNSYSAASSAADSVPCRDCCRCGCNAPSSDENNYPSSPYNQHGFVNDNYGYNGAEFEQQPFYSSYDNQQYSATRKVRRHNPYSIGYFEPATADQPMTKAQQVSDQTGLTPEQCEARFPYRCGVKEFPVRPVMPQFPSEELGVPMVKCCYYAQRPFKKCSMGDKCYHAHDDEDGDVVPEAFADGRDRSETRGAAAKLSYAAVAAASKAAHSADPHNHSHDGSEIATVPQSVCGHDDDDDARTTAGRAVESCACQPCDYTPTITRAQLATVPCQYGANCAIPRHALTATKCGFTAAKLARYKQYLTDLRQYGLQLGQFKKARADVRAESAQLQQISNAAKADASRQMRVHLRPRAEDGQSVWQSTSNDFAPKPTSVTWASSVESSAAHTTPYFSNTADLLELEAAVPCKHCGEAGQVHLRSMPVYKPNPNYDGVRDQRREVRKSGVGASCGSCGKTFAFDDAHALQSYIASFTHSSLVKEEPPTISFQEGAADAQLAFVEDLPW